MREFIVRLQDLGFTDLICSLQIALTPTYLLYSQQAFGEAAMLNLSP